MEYRFDFDKKRLFLVAAGLLFAGVLIFCCGVVTGIGLWMPARKQLAAVQPANKLPESPAKAAPLPGSAPAQPPVAVPAGTSEPVKAPPAKPEAIATAPPAPVNEPFVLQLGAFREQKNARQLQAELKLKGYPTIIFNMLDEDQRTWHMVRFGGYKDLTAASVAASDLIGKEGIQALVRRSDSL